MGDNNVIELADRVPPDMDLLTCGCGEAWWVLDGWPRGAVAVDLEGNVVARYGDLVCMSCGTHQEDDG